MELNADFTKRVVVHAPQLDWLPSPMPGVHRRMLDRVGDEVARATTIVRYAPGSAFSPHVHEGGEEFLVLQGVFQDEHGDYPVGTYVRNPPTSSHTPGSAEGCVIFVKLRQFQPSDRQQFAKRISVVRHPHPELPGVRRSILFEDDFECVEVQDWAPGVSSALQLDGGAEYLILDGELTLPDGPLKPQSWLRVPPGGTLVASAGQHGATLWTKSGHLRGVT